MKTGLILEGGAMRGMFTAGILDVFMENGIEFDGAVGVSAGAAFGCNFKSRQIGRTIRYNMKYSRNWRYCSWLSLLLTGSMYGTQLCYHDIPERLDPFDNEEYNRNPLRFYVVATDVETGKAEYRCYEEATPELIEFMRASASMPFVSKIVEIGGRKFLDGGIADSVPLRFFESEGYDRNVVILTREDGYVKEKNPLVWLAKIQLRKYPKMIEAIASRHEMYNEQIRYIKEKEEKGKIIVIRPKAALKLGHTEHDPEVLRSVYEEGRQAGLENLDRVREFLKK